jgi:DNA repair protein RecO (recombination protein O)
MRVSQQPAYILHHYSYGETSLLLEVFSREYGRLGLLAKGARRLRQRQRILLEAFQPLLIGWSGKGELPVLSAAELASDAVSLQGQTLYCAFYLNELLLRLLHRHDPHQALYDVYADALHALAGGKPMEVTLRVFEKRLLQEIGYGLVLESEMVNNAPIDPQATYQYVVNRGPMRVVDDDRDESSEVITVRGSSLIALAQETFSDPLTLQESKVLMRATLRYYLAGKPINTRKLFRNLRDTPLGDLE